MKRKTTLNIVIIVSFLILQSCASFQKNAINPKLLTEKNITELNGKYNIIDIEADSIRKKNWASNNFFTELESKIFFKPTKLDTLKTYQFELKVLSKKRIQINYLENDKIFKERIVKGKLKKDGYLIFDDFLWNFYSNPNENPIGAIKLFLKENFFKLKIVSIGYQIILKKL